MAGHERERALAVAAVAGVLERCWAVRDGLGGIDWRWLLSRLDPLGLGALMFAEAERAGISQLLPADVLAHLRRSAEDTAAQNAQLLAAALRTGALLDAAGIPWMPMKGVAVAIVAPDHFSSRPTSDFDVLVRPADLERAAEVLARGLERSRTFTDFGGAGVALTADAAIASETHHVHVFRSREGVSVELHHGFPGVAQEEATRIWSRAASRPVGRTVVLTPSLDDLLATTCAHVHLHHANEALVALRHLADVRALTSLGAGGAASLTRGAVATSIRDLAEARADAETARGPGGAAWRAIAPGAWDRAMAARSRVGGLATRVRKRLRAEGLAAIFPSRTYMTRHFGESTRGAPLPLLYVRHWAEYVLRTIKGR